MNRTHLKKTIAHAATLCALALMAGNAAAADEPAPVQGKSVTAVIPDALAQYGNTAIDAAEIRAALTLLDPRFVDAVKRSTFSASNLVTDILLRKSVAAQARAAGLDKDPEIAARLAQVIDAELFNAYVEREVRAASDPKLAEKLAREEYRAFPERFRQDEQAHVRHILVKTCECAGEQAKEQARAKAEAILARLKKGESFAELATAESDDLGSASRGGDLGFFGRGKTVKPFEDAAFALKKPGQLSDIVETQFGFHILRLEEPIKTGRQQSFDEVRDNLVAAASARLDAETRQKIGAPVRAPGAIAIDAAALREALGASWDSDTLLQPPTPPRPRATE
ncbi:MAG: peptidyl-prolyl cis-trans isomerase [Azoarcus sp.]|jgi:peptidyl-prolyl cis-trans isomerase C|nr:peptidyl-prolyl cis-trans isomerase [Azoarcus sp.]